LGVESYNDKSKQFEYRKMQPIIRITSFLFLMFMCQTLSWCQSLCNVEKIDDHNGLSQWWVTGIVKDKSGMLWISTWNGLNRYDGYNFEVFKSVPGDSCFMRSDRMSALCLSASEDSLLLRVDVTDQFCFNLDSYKFGPDTCLQNFDFKRNRLKILDTDTKNFYYTDHSGIKWTIGCDGSVSYLNPTTHLSTPCNVYLADSVKLSDVYADEQDILWAIDYVGIYKFELFKRPIEPFPQEKQAMIRAFMLDKEQRYWVASKEDETVRLFNADNQLLGYLSPDGRLQKGYTQFGARVYCMFEDAYGTIWLGTKPNGIFRLRSTENGNYRVTHFVNNADSYSLSNNDVYDFQQDALGRLWVATFGGGLNCIDNPGADEPRFLHSKNTMHLPEGGGSAMIHRIMLTHDQKLLAASIDGLIVADATEQNLSRMEFRFHKKEVGRSESLSNSACMDLLETSSGDLLIATESGGVNRLVPGTDLLAPQLNFLHYGMRNGFASDVALSLFEDADTNIWIVSNNQIIKFNMANGENDYFDADFLHEQFHFSDAHPLLLPDGRYLFGHYSGAFTMRLDQLHKSDYEPPIALTGLSVQGGDEIKNVNHLDTLVLQTDERSLTLNFAALDYRQTDKVRYAYLLDRDGEKLPWNSIGQSHTVTLLDLKPGTCQLHIRSTNSDGVWVDNERVLTLIVKPHFYETLLAKIAFVILVLGLTAAITAMLNADVRLRRHQRKLLNRYLEMARRGYKAKSEEASTEKDDDANTGLSHNDTTANSDDRLFMSRVLAFTEQQMSNPDASIEDMALATSKSVSALTRKMKGMLGVTPAEFLRNARLQRACQLLEEGHTQVQEVAMECGFSDAKYFSKCFKQKFGASPTAYKTGKENV